jgi:hypothetical protein
MVLDFLGNTCQETILGIPKSDVMEINPKTAFQENPPPASFRFAVGVLWPADIHLKD